MARPYAVHEAKAKLSEILRRVKRGRSVVIAERGREIARVVPVDRSGDLASRVEQLRRDGLIVRPAHVSTRVKPVVRRPGALRRFLESRG